MTPANSRRWCSIQNYSIGLAIRISAEPFPSLHPTGQVRLLRKRARDGGSLRTKHFDARRRRDNRNRLTGGHVNGRFFKWRPYQVAKRTKSATFCVLPWVHAATVTDGNVQLCCVAEGASGINLNEQTLADYWQSPYVKEARRLMLAGKQVAACDHCYREEAHGYRSHRLVENEVWQNRCGEDGIRRLVDGTAPDGSLD